LQDVREQFFLGELTQEPQLSRSKKPEQPSGPLSAEQMMNLIDARLRRVVVRSCCNSYPASQVVARFESFLVQAFAGEKNKTPNEEWEGILIEPPTVTHRMDSPVSVAKFYFDAETATGGFNRLLLHGLCQFHGLQATSATVNVLIQDHTQARVLTVFGTLSGSNVQLVEHIMQQQQPVDEEPLEVVTTKMASVKV
jgi:hypothetical protein